MHFGFLLQIFFAMLRFAAGVSLLSRNAGATFSGSRLHRSLPTPGTHLLPDLRKSQIHIVKGLDPQVAVRILGALTDGNTPFLVPSLKSLKDALRRVSIPFQQYQLALAVLLLQTHILLTYHALFQPHRSQSLCRFESDNSIKKTFPH